MNGGVDHACDVLRPPFQAVDAQQVAKAVGMQHPMQEMHCGVKDGHWSHKGGPCKQAALYSRPTDIIRTAPVTD